MQEIISSESTHVYFFYNSDEVIGFSEVDCTNQKNIEIVHFGLRQSYIGRGYGKELFKRLLKDLWELSPDRIHLSTCGLDHNNSINFYQKAGLTIYDEKQDVEFEDYRYSDFYEMTDAPQIPLAEEKT